MRFTGIHHLAMATPDMDATIRFWRDLLGMRLVIGMGRPGYRHYFFEISEHDLIAFFEWESIEKIPEKDHGVPARGPFAFDHISFGMPDDDSLWDVKDRLEAAGFWVSEMIDHGFIHSIYSFDPNNIPIEFSAPVADLDLRSRPKNIDPRPSPVAAEGAEPQPSRWPPPASPNAPEERQIYPGEGRSLIDSPSPPI
jgi:catechol 2,3-dioxygenase-like lactoylglutathione lyase family enzyme